MPEDLLSTFYHRFADDSGELVRVIIELVLVALALNWAAGKLEGTRGTRPLRRLLVVLLIATLGTRLLTLGRGWDRLDILYQFFVVGVAITALVAFQPELRRAFIRAGDSGTRGRRSPAERLIATLVKSAGFLSRNKYGALIAIQRSVSLRGWAENGTVIDAEVSPNLLNSVFFPNSPLHDLGTIIHNNRMLAANCQFPTAESDEVDAALGSRHLAAIGMSYESDALVLVVSEETGAIALADNGHLSRYLSLDDLERELTERLGTTPRSKTSSSERQRSPLRTFRYTLRRAAIVLPLTLVVWYLADQATLGTITRVPVTLIMQAPPGFAATPDREQAFVDLRGPQAALDRIRESVANDALEVVWTPPESLNPARDHQLPTVELLDRLADFRGVDVTTAAPRTVDVLVDRLESRSVPVVLDTGAVLIGDDFEIVPPAVEIELPSHVWTRIPAGQRRIVAPLADRLSTLPARRVHRIEGVPLARAIGSITVDRVVPAKVDVTLRPLAASGERTLEEIPVDLRLNRAAWDLLVEARRRVERVDDTEWTLATLRVAGPNARLNAISALDVTATVELPLELLASTEEQSIPVTLRLPEGFGLVGPPPRVRIRVVENEGAAETPASPPSESEATAAAERSSSDPPSTDADRGDDAAPNIVDPDSAAPD